MPLSHWCTERGKILPQYCSFTIDSSQNWYTRAVVAQKCNSVPLNPSCNTIILLLEKTADQNNFSNKYKLWMAEMWNALKCPGAGFSSVLFQWTGFMLSNKGMAQLLFWFLVVVLTGTYNKEPHRSLGHDLCVAWWRHWSCDEYYQWESCIRGLKELLQNLLWFSVLLCCPAILSRCSPACFVCLNLEQNSANRDRATAKTYMALYLNKWSKYKSLAFIRLVSLKFTLLCQESVFYTYSAGIQYTLHVDSQHFHTHLLMRMLIVFSLQLLCFVQDPLQLFQACRANQIASE